MHAQVMQMPPFFVVKTLRWYKGESHGAHRTRTQGIVKLFSSCTLVMYVKRYASTCRHHPWLIKGESGYPSRATTGTLQFPFIMRATRTMMGMSKAHLQHASLTGQPP